MATKATPNSQVELARLSSGLTPLELEKVLEFVKALISERCN
jgi:hypothetical protein